ncbi:MAG: glycosidase like protein [Bacteroidetes bacterium]|nr:glycosidase like protein [Bacteroidota bacterium]
MSHARMKVERCNGGRPIISPTDRWWENGVTFNAAALYLERSAVNDPILRTLLPERHPDDPMLAEGVVVIHYRARPETDPTVPFVRSFIGLAVFTPGFELLARLPDPVVSPESSPHGFDYLGVEDPRITRIGDTFYMVYCGLKADPRTIYHAQLCVARSRDLLRWEKLGPVRGDVNRWYNKDGVLFPEAVNGMYYFLHRPWWNGLPHSDYAMRIARSAAPDGEWEDMGEILHSFRNPGFTESWVGGGSVPIRVDGQRYIMIYHTGNSRADGFMEYDLDAALVDLGRLSKGPGAIVVSRVEHFMVPEVPAELETHSTLQVKNVLFACGSYVYRGFVYIVYGGADTYTLVARVRLSELLAAVESADLSNPFLD